jgi:hypothetical protein
MVRKQHAGLGSKKDEYLPLACSDWCPDSGIYICTVVGAFIANQNYFE